MTLSLRPAAGRQDVPVQGRGREGVRVPTAGLDGGGRTISNHFLMHCEVAAFSPSVSFLGFLRPVAIRRDIFFIAGRRLAAAAGRAGGGDGGAGGQPRGDVPGVRRDD